MQTKIRSAIIALVAAFSFAATVAPAAQALATRVPIGTPGGNIPTTGVAESKNDGRYKDSAEGRKKERERCAGMWRTVEEDKADFEKAKAKDPYSAETKAAWEIWAVALQAYRERCSHV